MRGGLIGEMLLLRLFVSSVARKAIRAMSVVAMRRSVSGVARRDTH